jgi:hypothetical protein
VTDEGGNAKHKRRQGKKGRALISDIPGEEEADVHLLQACQDKDCSLSHTRLGLAEDIGTEDGLRDTFLLNLGRVNARVLPPVSLLTLRRVLKTEVRDSSQELWLEEEIPVICQYGAFSVD